MLRVLRKKRKKESVLFLIIVCDVVHKLISRQRFSRTNICSVYKISIHKYVLLRRREKCAICGALSLNPLYIAIVAFAS